MQNKRIYKRRLEQFIERIYGMRYGDSMELNASYTYHKNTPIPYADALKASYKPIKVGAKWGELWGCSWFKFEGAVPEHFVGKEVLALIDVGGEGCVFVNGNPERGITYKAQRKGPHVKRRVPVGNPAKKGQTVSLLVEGGANGLFGDDDIGNSRVSTFHLRQAELVVFNRDIWDLTIDMQVLMELAATLPEDSPRAEKILYGLNEVVNTWQDGSGIAECKKITEKLLAVKANASDMTVWSIGHAHIDLGWLWPVRETRRKGGRTFSTALRLMEEYPEYKFGASQPQLFEWVKEDYPALYDEVKSAVAAGKFELQGAMWVEPDMNITGGESLVRQCLYGKNYYSEEFGKDVRNLWLPDVFGYSAALPQILKKSGVDIFMTQKISWNEMNTFPHHTFMWEGIDGTEILTHFLPTNNYNLENRPEQLAAAQKRFAQSDVQDDFLNLFGIGDGGGGPSRQHIEYGRRLQNTEGSPKFKFAFAEEFFDKIAKTPAAKLPKWAGELYLELHRGTLTTQGLMKRYNRQLELRLREVELLSAMAGTWNKETLDVVWKNTLLNQFHDILPGSSITWVYKDAHEMSRKNLSLLAGLQEESLSSLFGPTEKAKSATHVLVNALSWDRKEIVELPAPAAGDYVAVDPSGALLDSHRSGKSVIVSAEIPSMGYTTVTLEKAAPAKIRGGVACTESSLQNSLVRVRLAKDGTISSIYDKTAKREVISKAANQLLLWEDLPYSWDAWDVSHYYRETTPTQATLVSRRVVEETPLKCTIEQELTVGSSTITQRITLVKDSKLVTVSNNVDWKEKQKLLKVHADTTLLTRSATYEIQYGQIERPTHSNTSWDEARFEVAAQRFADLSESGFGLALVNDCKYGYSAYGNSIELSLLRSPKSPDPVADMAIHEFTYGYLVHSESLADSTVLRTAHELNSPVITQATSAAPKVPEMSWFSIDGENVNIETVKRAEDGNGTVVRLYEAKGSSVEVVLKSATEWKTIQETDLLEKPVGRAAGAGNSHKMKFGPYEIRTVRLR